MTAFRLLEKARREAQSRADEKDAPVAVVDWQGRYLVRELAKAQALCRKHNEALIADVLYPQNLLGVGA